MGAPKGHVKYGGRKKGTVNKATADVRSTIALIAERNVTQLERWMEAIAKDDPNKAADLFLRMIEYHIPKLQRSELTGKDGGPLVANFLSFDDGRKLLPEKLGS